jgi:hypothetical protein
MTTTTKIQLRHIRLNGGTQPRAELNEEHIERLKAALQEGEELPPIVCYHDGSEYWLADGFHRVQAHYRCLRIDITAEVRQGTRRDAVLYSLSANRTHGLPRTRADTQRSIQTMLADAEWSRFSDREIARTVGCSHATVGAIRAKLESTGQIDQLPARIGGDGKERSTTRYEPGPCPICGATAGNKVGAYCQDTCYHLKRARELGKTSTGAWHLDIAQLGIVRVEEPDRQAKMEREVTQVYNCWAFDEDRARREEIDRQVGQSFEQAYRQTHPNEETPEAGEVSADRTSESQRKIRSSIMARAPFLAHINSILASLIERMTDEETRLFTYLITDESYPVDTKTLKEDLWEDARSRLLLAPDHDLVWIQEGNKEPSAPPQK